MQWVLFAILQFLVASGFRRVNVYQEAVANGGGSGSQQEATAGDQSSSEINSVSGPECDEKLKKCCLEVWPDKKGKPGYDLPLKGFAAKMMEKKGGCPAGFQPELCKPSKGCTEIWPEKKGKPGYDVPLGGFGLKMIEKKCKDAGTPCPNFDPAMCDCYPNNAEDEDDEEADAPGAESTLTFIDKLPEGSWKDAKVQMKKTRDKLVELLETVTKEEEALHNIGAACFDDIMLHMFKEGYVLEENADVRTEAVEKWKQMITPKQFKDLFGSDKMGMKQIGQLLLKPDLFKVRLDALTKLFIMMHKSGGDFWEDLKGKELRWPVAMFEGTDKADALLPSLLEEITNSWSQTCGKDSSCDATMSCWDSSTNQCVARKAISYDPNAGPLDRNTFSTINRQWRCISNPEMLSAKALEMCEVCNGLEECKGVSAESHEARLGKLATWLSGRSITDCKGKGCYDASAPDWFTTLSQADKDVILAQATAMGDLDPQEVPGPLTPEEKTHAAAMMKKLTIGIDFQRPFMKWLMDTDKPAFGGRFTDKDKAREVFRQVSNIRDRTWREYPQCPPATTDCLGPQLHNFLSLNEATASSFSAAREMLEKASTRWKDAAEAKVATQILETPTPLTEDSERQQYKEAIDTVVKEMGSASRAASKVQKLVYEGKKAKK